MWGNIGTPTKVHTQICTIRYILRSPLTPRTVNHGENSRCRRTYTHRSTVVPLVWRCPQPHTLTRGRFRWCPIIHPSGIRCFLLDFSSNPAHPNPQHPDPTTVRAHFPKIFCIGWMVFLRDNTIAIPHYYSSTTSARNCMRLLWENDNVREGQPQPQIS